MHFLIIMILAILLSFGGCGLMFCGLCADKHEYKKTIAWISFAVLIVGIIGFASMNNAIKNTEVSNTTEEIYDIDKLTTGQVYFTNKDDNNIGISLAESYIEVKQSDRDIDNVVVKTTEDKVVNWLIDFEYSSAKYEVLLDADVYARYKNNNILFERSSE